MDGSVGGWMDRLTDGQIGIYRFEYKFDYIFLSFGTIWFNTYLRAEGARRREGCCNCHYLS